MTNDQLGKALVAAGLMPVGEVKTLWASIPAEQRPKDAEGFADLLVTQGKLSKFQATELLSGSTTPLILGDYQLLDKIGAGGMGQVFKAQHRHMKRTVAIKLLPADLTKDEGAIKRFQREVEAAAKLSHPNIVQAFDASTQRGVWYLVMEYVEGRDLSGIIAAEGSLPIPRAVNYIRQSARGLGFAHENGVVHRDIKPANLLLDKKGTVKILDMGLARFDDGMAAQQEGLTQSGQVMGTVDYMAPEQAFDTRHADARADVYSLGCTLFRLLTAQNMYEGESLVQKLMGHQSKPIPKLTKFRADIPAALEAVFERMVAKDPKERYQTMAEVVQALAPFEEGGKPDDGGGLTAHFEGIGGGTATNAALLEQQTAAYVTPISVNPTVSLNNPLQTTDPVSARSIQLVLQNTPRPAAAKRPPGNRKKLLIAAGGLGGVLAVLLGIWVIIKDKDGKEVARVQVPEGGTAAIQTDLDPGKGTPPANQQTAKPTSKSPALSVNDPTRWPFDPPDGKEYVWSEPENLGPSVNTAKDEQMPTLSADELRLVFRIESSSIDKSSLAECVRSSLSEPFKPRTQLTGSAYEIEPALSADGLSLLYDTHALPKGRSAKDIRIRQRTALDAPWGKPETISFDGDHDEQTPWLSPDGLTLMYSSKRPDSVAESRDLWTVRRKSITEPFGASESLGNDINSDKSELGGQLFDRERIVFFQRDGKPRLTVKAKAGSNFTQHHDLPEYVRGGWLSSDGLRLYFHSKTLAGGFGGDDIWVTRRVPKSGTTLVDSALQFDGDDLVELPTLKFDPAGSYTLEGYITAPVKADKGAGLAFGMPKQSYLSFTRLSDWRWVYFPHSGGDKGRDIAISGAPARPERTHIACVRDGNAHRLYVDGKLFQKTADIAAPATGNSPFQIGSEFRGTIDELRVSKVARYKADFTPTARFESDADTLGLYHFDEGAGEVLNDSSGNNHHGKIVGATWVKSDAPPPPANPVVYLDDLQEVEYKILADKPLGKHGKYRDGPGTEDTAILFRGQPIAHTLWMHPPRSANLVGFARYQLEGRYTTFVAEAGVSESSNNDPQSPITFRVLGDGRELWKSPPLQKRGESAEVSVDVRGVKELRLEAASGDKNGNCHATWFMPRLTPAAASTSSTINKFYMHDPAFPQWMKDVQAMPADKQIEAVSKKLIELNPGFDGVLLGRDRKGGPTIENGVVKAVNFDPIFVTDLSPLRAFVGLAEINGGSTGTRGRGKLSDLSPLAGLPLTSVSMYVTSVIDLSPLRGMPIGYLNCGDIWITDLQPLKDMPIRQLHIPVTKVSDLSPLAGGPLQLLNCERTPVTDLSPLEKCRELTSLNVKGTKVTAAGVAALQKALPNCKIEWDEPAKSAKAWETPAFQQWIADTQKLPAAQQIAAVSKKLMELNPNFDGKLMGLKETEPPKIENGVVTELYFITENVKDVSPVRALSGLKSLYCTGLTKKAPFQDLSALNGLPLAILRINSNEVANLAPLQGMPLTQLFCGNTNVSDLTPLQESKTLRYLFLKSSRVNAAGVAALQKALPECKIEREISATEASATVDPQRRAAEWVFSKGGSLELNDGIVVRELKELPPGPLLITKVSLVSKGLSAEETNLVMLRELTDLRFLTIYSSTGSPAGVAGMERIPGLERLSWGMVNLDDKAVAAIGRLKKLHSLYIVGSTISEGQLEALAQAAVSVTSLNLQSTKVKEGTEIKPLDDKVLPSLTGFKKLRLVQLQGTAVTAAGIASLQKALPDCKIEWDNPAATVPPK